MALWTWHDIADRDVATCNKACSAREDISYHVTFNRLIFDFYMGLSQPWVCIFLWNLLTFKSCFQVGVWLHAWTPLSIFVPLVMFLFFLFPYRETKANLSSFFLTGTFVDHLVKLLNWVSSKFSHIPGLCTLTQGLPPPQLMVPRRGENLFIVNTHGYHAKCFISYSLLLLYTVQGSLHCKQDSL